MEVLDWIMQKVTTVFMKLFDIELYWGGSLGGFFVSIIVIGLVMDFTTRMIGQAMNESMSLAKDHIRKHGKEFTSPTQRFKRGFQRWIGKDIK